MNDITLWGRRGVTGLAMGSAAGAAAQGHTPALHAQATAAPPAAAPATAVAPAAAPPAGGGDLSRQTPIDILVELGGADGQHRFHPGTLRLRTGLLYRLTLRNGSRDPHYFTSDGLAASVWTRKTQVLGAAADGSMRVMAEIKGAIREIEVHPGFAAEWWFVPVQAGRFDDLRCEIRSADGRSHAEQGMRGSVVIE